MNKYQYEGNIVLLVNGKFHCFILKVTCDSPNFDTVKEFEASSMEEAQIWVDDETSRLYTGKGLWE